MDDWANDTRRKRKRESTSLTSVSSQCLPAHVSSSGDMTLSPLPAKENVDLFLHEETPLKLKPIKRGRRSRAACPQIAPHFEKETPSIRVAVAQ